MAVVAVWTTAVISACAPADPAAEAGGVGYRAYQAGWSYGRKMLETLYKGETPLIDERFGACDDGVG